MELAAERQQSHARPTLSLEGTKLVDASGQVFGELVGLEIDLTGDPWGTYGGERGGLSRTEASLNPTEPENQHGVQGGESGEQTSMLANPVQEVWDHYELTFPGTRRKLDDRRKRVIRKALRVRSVDECKRAITELSRSKFHRGDNDTGVNYTDIDYALGKKSQSPDAVIDRWLERGGQTNDMTPVQRKLNSVPANLKHIVTEKMQRVRRMYRSPSHEPTVEAGRRAVEDLRSFPGIEPVEDDGHFKGWRVCDGQ